MTPLHADRNAVTALMERSSNGSQEALQELVPLVYRELRRLAGGYMRNERQGHTLQPTALVNEAFTRLAGADIAWHSRAQFFKAAARAMRRVLVDHARARRSLKRGGDLTRVTLADGLVDAAGSAPDALILDQALTRLEEKEPRKRQVVELHYFCGLSFLEIADTLEISAATVDRDMSFARAWLRQQLIRGGPEDREG